VKRLKRELELSVLQLIRDFEDVTDTSISIDTDQVRNMKGIRKTVGVTISVKIGG
jgi:hypothetical protein